MKGRIILSLNIKEADALIELLEQKSPHSGMNAETQRDIIRVKCIKAKQYLEQHLKRIKDTK